MKGFESFSKKERLRTASASAAGRRHCVAVCSEIAAPRLTRCAQQMLLNDVTGKPLAIDLRGPRQFRQYIDLSVLVPSSNDDGTEHTAAADVAAKRHLGFTFGSRRHTPPHRHR
jgi:hypothetical protein